MDADLEYYPSTIAYEGLTVSAPTAKGTLRLLRSEYGERFGHIPDFTGPTDQSEKTEVMKAYKDRALPSLGTTADPRA